MTILITGGSGFLGSSLVRYFRQQGADVRSFDLNASVDPAVETILGDLRDAEAVAAACAGVDTVIHSAALISQQLGRPQPIYDVNVRGTQHVIDACQRHGVRRLIYTSSIDVVFDGRPIRDGDETLPYARRHLDYYGTTKMQAEQIVRAANGQRGLTTCILRTAGIYGPGDRHRMPAVLRSVLDTGAMIRIGDGSAQFTHVYVDNVAHAHWLAAQRLAPGSPLAGETYFITDAPPGNFFQFFIPYLEALKIGHRVRAIPFSVAWGIASALETRYRLRPTEKNSRVPLSRYVVASTARDFWFNHHKAARDFDYAPVITPDAAFDATLAWATDWLADTSATADQSATGERR